MKHIADVIPAAAKHKELSEREALRMGHLMRVAHGRERADIAYMARMLVICTLPHSEDKLEEGDYVKRENGDYKLYLQPAPEMGLPYGVYPRLILAWMTTEVKRTQSRTLVLGDSLSAFMDELGLKPTGGRWGTIHRLQEQMERLFACRIWMRQTNQARSKGQGTQVADKYELWWQPESIEQKGLFESKVTIGKELYEDMLSKGVPFDMRVLKLIKQSPLAIDLYIWLTYRVSYLERPVYISWAQLHEQFGSDYNALRNFSYKAKEAIKTIKIAWPGLDYETPRGRLMLNPCSPHVAKQVKS